MIQNLSLRKLIQSSFLVISLFLGLGQSSEQSDSEPIVFDAESLIEELRLNPNPDPNGAIEQLRFLGPLNISVLEDALQIPNDSVKKAAIEALGEIGNEPALELLRTCFLDTTFYEYIRVGAVQALVYAKDMSSIPLFENEAAQSRCSTVKVYASRAAQALQNPGLNFPLFEYRDNRIWPRFLEKDIKRIAVQDGPVHWLKQHEFEPDQFPGIINNLLTSPKGSFSGVLIADMVLVIELGDGRRTEFSVTQDTFIGGENLLSLYRRAIIVKNESLRSYLDHYLYRNEKEKAGEN